MTRREFLSTSAFTLAAIPLGITSGKPLRFGVITDIHHGLAPDSLSRLETFVEATSRRDDLAFVVQLGDFCHSYPPSEYAPFLKMWNTIRFPKLHVLGNHDMDRGSKGQAMKLWGMASRYGSVEVEGWRIITLDLNHFRKDGQLVAYERGNYFTDNATHNWADPEQLEWLDRELSRSHMPTIVLSHQPLGFAEPGKTLPPEQQQVMDILRGRVAVSLFGHLHVDRMERVGELPFLCVNSASYFWQDGMHPYRDALFAFVELGTDGVMRVEGIRSEFSKGKPPTNTIGCSPSIENRTVRLPK